MISVDGDTSTNDTLLVLANGMAENPEITEEDAEYEAFCEALHVVTTYAGKEDGRRRRGRNLLCLKQRSSGSRYKAGCQDS